MRNEEAAMWLQLAWWLVVKPHCMCYLCCFTSKMTDDVAVQPILPAVSIWQLLDVSSCQSCSSLATVVRRSQECRLFDSVPTCSRLLSVCVSVSCFLGVECFVIENVILLCTDLWWCAALPVCLLVWRVLLTSILTIVRVVSSHYRTISKHRLSLSVTYQMKPY